jgi:tetratricopeptide (TPR) repeat protein
MVTLYESPGEAQQAEPHVKELLTKDPEYLPALMVSALLQEQRSNYTEAEQIYIRALARYPLFAPATKQLAMLYAEHLGDDAKAYPLALKAREVFPEDADLPRTLGILAYRRGDYARSAQLLKESARKRSSDAELLYYLGMAHYRLKEKRESKDALKHALALNIPTKLSAEAKRVIGELE